MAYNEGANIGGMLDGLRRQSLCTGTVDEIVVVASGCTDDTEAKVEAAMRYDPRVRLLRQRHRYGKASALNLFIAQARSPILVLAGGDTVLAEHALEHLLAPLADERVGMVGARPVPVNDETTFLGHAVHLLWRLHDQIARTAPKLGEFVAFRNVIPAIPVDTAVDEISIEALISQLGYELRYEPLAIVYNRGPETILDLLRQRRRIAAGHRRVRRQQGYAASTTSPLRIAVALAQCPGAFDSPQKALWTIGAAGLECAARISGAFDDLQGSQHHIWDIATTTKAALQPALDGVSSHSVLVFRIVDHHQYEMSIGARPTAVLERSVLMCMRKALDRDVEINPTKGGALIVSLRCGRDEAEKQARRLSDLIEATAFPATRQGVKLKLACAVIAFAPGGTDVVALIHQSAEPASI